MLYRTSNETAVGQDDLDPVLPIARAGYPSVPSSTPVPTRSHPATTSPTARVQSSVRAEVVWVVCPWACVVPCGSEPSPPFRFRYPSTPLSVPRCRARGSRGRPSRPLLPRGLPRAVRAPAPVGGLLPRSVLTTPSPADFVAPRPGVGGGRWAVGAADGLTNDGGAVGAAQVDASVARRDGRDGNRAIFTERLDETSHVRRRSRKGGEAESRLEGGRASGPL